MYELIYEGEILQLLPEKAVFWKNQSMLFIADLHLGKSSHFRKEGIPISAGCHEKDLNSLREIIERYKPATVLFLGDLFHSSFNNEWTIFKDFLTEFPEVDFILTQGNHDILKPYHYASTRLKLIKDNYQLGKLWLSHHPCQPHEGLLNLAGHIHPGITISNKIHSVKLPCFYLNKNCLILPAFGSLTGLSKIKPEKNSEVFAIVGNEVLKI